MKGTDSQEDITNLKNNNLLKVGDFNAPVCLIDMPFRTKINRKTSELTNIIHQRDLTTWEVEVGVSL